MNNCKKWKINYANMLAVEMKKDGSSSTLMHS